MRKIVATLLCLAALGLPACTNRDKAKDEPPPTTSSTPSPTPTPVKPISQTILLIGLDTRTDEVRAVIPEVGSADGSQNADTVMLLHLSADNAAAQLISFPRDTYTAVPGIGNVKLNAAFHRGYNDAGGSEAAKLAAGAALLSRTITTLSGAKIDHWVTVDFLGFHRISEAIGGVQVTMCRAVNDPYSTANLRAGVNVIKGRQALAFVRQRQGLPNGDLDRVLRQQYFLSEAFRAVVASGRTADPAKLEPLIELVGKHVHTDPKLDIAQLGGQLAQLKPGTINGNTIPNRGVGDTEVGSVVLVDPAQVRRTVTTLFQQNPKPAPVRCVN